LEKLRHVEENSGNSPLAPVTTEEKKRFPRFLALSQLCERSARALLQVGESTAVGERGFWVLSIYQG